MDQYRRSDDRVREPLPVYFGQTVFAIYLVQTELTLVVALAEPELRRRVAVVGRKTCGGG